MPIKNYFQNMVNFLPRATSLLARLLERPGLGVGIILSPLLPQWKEKNLQKGQESAWGRVLER